jgi:hypothetical protein
LGYISPSSPADAARDKKMFQQDEMPTDQELASLDAGVWDGKEHTTRLEAMQGLMPPPWQAIAPGES